jgi:TPR repeat protein
MRLAAPLGLAIGLTLAAPAAAQTFTPPFTPPAGPPTAEGPPPDTAFGDYQRGYFLTALREALKRVADNPKDAAAMTLIGEIYRDGYAVAPNEAEAARWYRVASGLGDREAAFALGMLLLNGADGVPEDRAGAKAQFEIAAAKGQPGALYNLGVMAIGDKAANGFPDFKAAAADFRRAAEAGYGDGAYSYGVLLREGKGVPLDIGESARWLKRAADAGVVAGQVEYAIMLFNGVGVAKDEAGAAKLLLRAAARNNPIAENRLAHLYASGRGVPKDLVEAATWNRFAKAAGIDDPDLDAATASLTPEENKRVDELIRRQAAF